MQRLQYFVSESCWEPGEVNGRRLELLAADPVTAPHAGGVLVIDDSGTARTARRPRLWAAGGKTDNGIVTVT